jgi:hypothetical protein
MKSNFMKRVHKYLLFNLLLLNQLLQAQPEFNDGNDVQDVPAAPINHYGWSVLVIVIALMFVFFQKRKTNQI